MSKKGDRYHHGDLRATLIEVTAAMIAEHGTEGVTVRGLAQRAGVSRSAPYRHFADKNALLAAVAEDGFTRLTGRIRQARNENPDDSVQSLKSACIAYIDFAVENPTHYRLMFEQRLVEFKDHPSLAVAARAAMNEMIAIVQQCLQEERVKPAAPGKLAQTAWALAHGLSLLLIDGRIQRIGDVHDLADFSIQALLDGIEE